MVLPQFKYLAPQTIDEACHLLMKLGIQAKIMAGGTDLIPLMKNKVFTPKYVIDIKNISELNDLKYDEEGLKIGALVKLRQIETSALIKKVNPSIAYSAKVIGSKQIRHKATMVGNICSAYPSYDMGANLVVQNAKVLVSGVDGQRRIEIEDFFVDIGQTALKPGEIVTGIMIPPLFKNETVVYMKHAVRKALDFAIVGVAVKLKVEDHRCLDIKIALAGVDLTPIRVKEAEAVLTHHRLSDENITKASLLAMQSCHPVSDIYASKEYRRDMVRVFTKRAILKALNNLEEGEDET